MNPKESMLIGGPSDGRFIKFNYLDEFVQITDPRQDAVSSFDPRWARPSMLACDYLTASRYRLELLLIGDSREPLYFYVHHELTTYDALHRLIHRYPTKQT